MFPETKITSVLPMASHQQMYIHGMKYTLSEFDFSNRPTKPRAIESNATELLGQLKVYLNRGESKTALLLLQHLPESFLLNNPAFYMHYIWALLCERRFDEAKSAREYFETNSYRILEDYDSEDIKLYATNTAVLGLLQFIFENDLNAISVAAMDRLKHYLDIPSHYQLMVTNIYAFLLFMNGRYEKARYFAAKAKLANADREDLYNFSISNVLIALSDRALGRYDLAIKGINSALACLSDEPNSPACSISQMLKALLLYDQNQLDQSKDIILNALPNLGIPAITEFLVHGYLVLARIEISDRNFDKATKILNSLVQQLDDASMQRWSSFITHEKVKVSLYLEEPSNDLDSTELNKRLNYYNSRYCPAVGHIPLRTALMVALHNKEHDLATNLLGQLSQICLLQRDSMLRIVLLSSTAVLEFNLGNREEACEYLNQALRASQQSGIIRALFEEVTGFDQLFYHALECRLIDADVSEKLIDDLKKVDFKLEHKKEILEPQPKTTVKTVKTEGNQDISLEALTQTEQKILLLLSQGLPNKLIASQCNINISTVKWHLKNIYSKLYVKNRTEAVIKAQQYQLVDA